MKIHLFSIEFAANMTYTARAKLGSMWRRWSHTTFLSSKRYVIAFLILFLVYTLVSNSFLSLTLGCNVRCSTSLPS